MIYRLSTKPDEAVNNGGKMEKTINKVIEAVSKCSISKSALICPRSRKAKILTGGIH